MHTCFWGIIALSNHLCSFYWFAVLIDIWGYNSAVKNTVLSDDTRHSQLIFKFQLWVLSQTWIEIINTIKLCGNVFYTWNTLVWELQQKYFFIYLWLCQTFSELCSSLLCSQTIIYLPLLHLYFIILGTKYFSILCFQYWFF